MNTNNEHEAPVPLTPPCTRVRIMACHEACHRCWIDFATGDDTNHACDCEECVPICPICDPSA